MDTPIQLPHRPPAPSCYRGADSGISSRHAPGRSVGAVNRRDTGRRRRHHQGSRVRRTPTAGIAATRCHPQRWPSAGVDLLAVECRAASVRLEPRRLRHSASRTDRRGGTGRLLQRADARNQGGHLAMTGETGLSAARDAGPAPPEAARFAARQCRFLRPLPRDPGLTTRTPAQGRMSRPQEIVGRHTSDDANGRRAWTCVVGAGRCRLHPPHDRP